MSIRMIVGAAVVASFSAGLSLTAETPKDQEAAKTALQKFHEYIGAWNGNGESNPPKREFWKESMNWGWKFSKDGSVALLVEFKDNKAFDKGEVKFLPDKKKFQLTVVGKDKKDQVYEGEIKQRRLVFTRVDPANMDKHTISMFTTNEGALFKMEYALQAGGRGLDRLVFAVNHKKEGASIGGGKKNECIVSGGVGTMPVSFNGKTYYVCCGGCRDAFNESEAAKKKFVEDFEKKNKK
jgi:hypothetical protein